MTTIQKNYIDFITENTITLIPGCNKIWATSNALAIIQTMMHNYTLMDDYGPVKANDYFCVLGASGGALKSLVPKVSTLPILKRVEKDLPCLKPEETDDDKDKKEPKSLFLPDAGSSEGLTTLMSNNEQTWGIIDQDEISKFCHEAKGKGYKSGDMEFLCKLYDARDTRRATTSRGLECVRNPYIVLIGSSTQHFIKSLHDGAFFRQGLGNRFVWSYIQPKDCKAIKKNDDFFDTDIRGDDTRFVWHDEVVKHLLDIFAETPRKMYMHQNASDLWREYDYDCQVRWSKANLKDVTGWEYQPIYRFPMHVLKTAMTYCLSESTIVDNVMSLEQPAITLTHMQKAIDFVKETEKDFDEIVNWKLLYSGVSTPRKDYIELAKQKYAYLKAHNKKTLFFSTEFIPLLNTETDYEREQIVDALKDLKYITMSKKSELTPAELIAIDWPDSREYNCVKAVRLLH